MKKLTILLTAIALVIGNVAVGQFTLTDSLQAWYPFTSNAVDSSSNNNNGTVNGATLTTDRFGNPNSAYSFDGLDDYIIISSSPSLDINGSISIICWIKINPTVTTGIHEIIFRGDIQSGKDPYLLKIVNGDLIFRRNVLDGQTAHDVATPIASFDPNEHYLISGVYDSIAGTMTLYIDTTMVDQQNLSAPINYSTNTMWNVIGAYNNGGGNYLSGVVDDVRIYNRAIDWCEVRYLYHGDSILPTISVNGFDLTSSSGVSYQWNLNDTAINGATSINYTALQNGSYTVTVVDSFGCEYTSKPVIITGVGIDQLADGTHQITIYPNPSGGKFTVSIPITIGRQGAIKKVEVYDLFGRKVLESKELEIDMSGFAKGFYFVHIGEVVKKVILQ